jgi:tetratricopeptide (TPR) repeat protein
MRTLPSQRERYYLACTKALEKTKRWRECTDACVKALERIPRYSGSGQLWIQRRLGLSLLEQGDFQHAAALIRRLLAHLDNWFLLDDLAKVEIELGQLAEAREHLRQALGRVGEIRMKVTTLRRMAQVCEKLGDVESACLHSRLAAAIRAEQGWSADPELDALARRLSCEAPPPAAAGLIAEALPLWQSGLPAGAAGGGRELGVVTSLLPSGKAGFIRPASGGPDLYFRTADVNEERTVLPGAEVTFKVTTGFDHKKQRATLNAVNIVMER